MAKETVHVYTDGSFDERTLEGSWCWYAPKLGILDFGYQKNLTSSNAAEKEAIINCCNALSERYKLIIHTDSEGMIGKFAKEAKRQAAGVPGCVEFIKVPGHKGIQGNMVCDLVCKRIRKASKKHVEAFKVVIENLPKEIKMSLSHDTLIKYLS